RQYAYSVGRFMQVDPYKGSCGADDPQSWNRYSYTRNDPVNRIDPLGLDDTLPEPFFCTNCYMEVPAGTTLVGGAGGGARHQPLLDTGPVGTGGGGGQGLADYWKYWKQLNPCEKKVARRFPLANFAVLQARETAERVAAELGGGDDNYANAVKHRTWSCIMTDKLNRMIAKAWGDAHECDRDGKRVDTPSSRMDLHNNKVGRDIGEKPEINSESDCINACKESGDLKRQPDT
ncbi:MAG TPA: RHS repeat-associated core domain-containing protein, partial [Blastocatellia bacterium]|nr:RHS repeat-associated core domain-containing protein [Blastocatellia bacterium]